MSHLGDTPRTDAEECEMFIGVSTFTPGDVQQAFHFARQLERELNAANQRIKQLEEMYEGVIGENPALLGSNVMGLLKRELTGTQKRIKRMEEVGDEMARWLSNSRNLGDDPFLSHKWCKAKEAKL